MAKKATFQFNEDINLSDKDGNTPLMNAIKKGDTDQITVLIGLGANIDYKNNQKQDVFDLIKESTQKDKLMKLVQGLMTEKLLRRVEDAAQDKLKSKRMRI